MFILRTLSVLALGSFALAGDPPKPVEKKPDASQLAKDLGSPVFAERDRASRELWKLGIAARPAIEKAANSDDPEVAQRANDILEKFDWGIFPDTPAGVLKQIKEFRSNDLERQTVAVSALIGIEVRGVETLALVLARHLGGVLGPRDRKIEADLLVDYGLHLIQLFAGDLVGVREIKAQAFLGDVGAALHNVRA